MGGKGGKGPQVSSPLQLVVWGKTQKRLLSRWVRGVLGPGGRGPSTRAAKQLVSRRKKKGA